MILGTNISGAPLDLIKLINTICADFTRIESQTSTFVESNPEWQEAIADIRTTYSTFLSPITDTPVSLEPSFLSSLKLSASEYQYANNLAILILFGISHYLHFNGYDIDDPTSFAEISNKLSFARTCILSFGIFMVKTLRGRLKVSKSRLKSADFETLKKAISIGLIIGSLIDEEHTH